MLSTPLSLEELSVYLVIQNGNYNPLVQESFCPCSLCKIKKIMSEEETIDGTVFFSVHLMHCDNGNKNHTYSI